MKKGFTLAEVLITLGIIGIVSAMTIPTLSAKIQKRKLESQIKVAYAEIQQAMKMAENDGMALNSKFKDNSDTEMQEWVNSYIVPNIKTENICLNKVGCWHKKGTVKDLQGNPSPWDNDNGLGFNIITFKTAKGVYYNLDGMSQMRMQTLFGVSSADSEGLVIYFDANGDRKPNKIGIDIYAMCMSEKGWLPAGYNKTPQEIKQNCERGNGYWCLKHVINSGWTINDKVWKR